MLPAAANGSSPSRIRWGLGVATAVLLLLALVVSSLPSGQAQTPDEILLRDSFTFSPNRIPLSPGQNVSIHLTNAGVTIHTFTLFATPDPQVELSSFPDLVAFYDASEKLVDASIPGGESDWANFTAPEVEANYLFVCMIAGHAATGMFGYAVVGNPAPPDGGGFVWPFGLVQNLFIAALVGAVVFAVIYQLRSRRL